MSEAVDLRRCIRSIPDFPKPGILFRDITPLLKEPAAVRQAVRDMAEPYRDAKVDAVLGAEARGFIFAALIAAELEAGIVPVRKVGKLPAETTGVTYDLEYGTDTLEMHADAIARGDHVLMVDDLLATGGTMAACCELVEKAGGEIAGIEFLIELAPLKGRERLEGYPVRSLIVYEGEES